MAKHVKDGQEKKVLLGVHDRDYRDNGRLAKDPSHLDYSTLNRAYKVQRYNYMNS